jgi:hypothetical protein
VRTFAFALVIAIMSLLNATPAYALSVKGLPGGSELDVGTGEDGALEGTLGGDQFELGIGRSSTTITNPNDSQAHYAGIGLIGTGRISVWGNRVRTFQLDLVGSMSYFESKNTVTISGQKESLFLLGPGAGLYARAYWFFLGYQLEYMFCRQYATGPVNNGIDYTMITSRLFYGVDFKVRDRYGLAFGISNTTGAIPKSRNGLSEDSPYKNQTLWLNLTYSGGQ